MYVQSDQYIICKMPILFFTCKILMCETAKIDFEHKMNCILKSEVFIMSKRKLYPSQS